MAQSWSFRDRLPAPPKVVFERLTDPRFLERFTELQGGRNAKATVVEETDERRLLRVRYQEPIDLLRQTIDAEIEQDWDRERLRNRWTRKGPGATVEGEALLEADGDGTMWIERGSISVSMPLVGGKIEKAVVEQRTKGRPAAVRYLLDALRGGGA
jgi:uncharacterized protein YndB with AHSA1/START domain